jgi:hypothetical protein
MSYDLYFEARQPDPRLNAAAFEAYFRARPNYQMGKGQALYENQTTGVYFIVDIGDVDNEEEPDLLPVSLNLNYFRPHIFGLEAELEIRNFVQHFGLRVSDPQIDGMSDGEYSTEKFLSGWNKGNEFGYSSFLAEPQEEPVLTLPGRRIEECWRWNFDRDGLQKRLGESVFVPQFMFLEREGAVKTMVVWPDAIPTALPTAELVVIPRKDILPKRFFRSREDMALVDWADVEPIISGFAINQGALPYRLLSYEEPSEEMLSALRAFPATDEPPEALPVDKILNAELVEKARTKQ